MKIVCCLVLLLLFTSCGKKKSSETLTPLNAPAKYGEVMGRALKKSKAMQDILYLKNKINTFQIQEGRFPNSLEEIKAKGYIDKLPEPPAGMKFVYDSTTGKVIVQ